MVGKTAPATTAQKARMGAIAELYCLPCMLEGIERSPTVQHVTEGRKRLGHDYTYGCCDWHHFGHVPKGLSTATIEATLGPSLAVSKRRYTARYGSERCLVKVQNLLIQAREAAAANGEYLPFDRYRALAVIEHRKLFDGQNARPGFSLVG